MGDGGEVGAAFNPDGSAGVAGASGVGVMLVVGWELLADAFGGDLGGGDFGFAEAEDVGLVLGEKVV